jgi:hypothetical protein
MKGRFQSVSSVFRWLLGPNVFSVSDHFNVHLGNSCRARVTSRSSFLPWVLEVLAKLLPKIMLMLSYYSSSSSWEWR